MDNNYDYEYDWDDQYYGTGPTQPPKSRGLRTRTPSRAVHPAASSSRSPTVARGESI